MDGYWKWFDFRRRRSGDWRDYMGWAYLEGVPANPRAETWVWYDTEAKLWKLGMPSARETALPTHTHAKVLKVLWRLQHDP